MGFETTVETTVSLVNEGIELVNAALRRKTKDNWEQQEEPERRHDEDVRTSVEVGIVVANMQGRGSYVGSVWSF